MPKQKKSFQKKTVSKDKSWWWISFATLIITIISTVFITVMILININKIKDFIQKRSNQTQNNQTQQKTWEDEIYIWTQIQTKWLLSNDWDLSHYTHRLHTTKYWSIWLISKTIDLNEYKWEITINWTVKKIMNELIIVDVESVDWEKIQIEVNSWYWLSGKYLPEVGVFMWEDFLQYFTFQNINSKTITLKQNLTWSTWNKIITINYFKCNSSNSNTNCKLINTAYSENSLNSFINKDWIWFYKSAESDSWFFSNKDRFGYFIYNVSGDVVRKIWENISFLTKDFVKESLNENIKNICKTWDKKLNSVSESKVFFEWNKIMLEVKWEWFMSNIKCDVEFDPAEKYDWILKNITVSWDDKKNIETWTDIEEDWPVVWENTDEKNIKNDDEKKEDKKDDFVLDDTNDSWLLDKKKDVKQFKINLDKTYTFESKRWYKIVFPSKNILFSAVTVDNKTLWVDKWVNCFMQLNVVSYKSWEDAIEKSPTIKMYQCSIKNWAKLPSKYRHIVFQDNKHFVISVVDPAWVDFAENIIIE